MNLKTRGFTLIELIVVILILGILAAIAAPRFVDLTGQARAASLNGLRAAVQSASTLANALQVAQNLSPGSPVTIEGGAVTMVNRYPDATTLGIGAAIRTDPGIYTITGAGPLTFQVTAATTPASCQFTYTAATATVPASVGAASTTCN